MATKNTIINKTAKISQNERQYNLECFCTRAIKNVFEALKDESMRKEFEDWYFEEHGVKYVWTKGWDKWQEKLKNARAKQI